MHVMIQLVHPLQGYFSFNKGFKKFPGNSLCGRRCSLYNGAISAFQKRRGAQFSLQGISDVVPDCAEKIPVPHKANFGDGVEVDGLPHVQTLRKFSKEELFGKVVMVRFHAIIFLGEKLDKLPLSAASALFTIKYLYEAGAKVVLVSTWNAKINSQLLSSECFAERLSSVLQLKVVPVKFVPRGRQSTVYDGKEYCILLLENLYHFKDELANCSKFAEQLSSGVDIFVNDSFSQSHKVLASTVGSVCFCYASVAGFHFEEDLEKLRKTVGTNRKPYFAIIGGGNLLEKAEAVHFLASRCDGLIFVGNMAFQIMHSQGLHVPTKLLEHGAIEEALNLIQVANSRSIPILAPKDFWCMNSNLPGQLKLFSANCILDDWLPVDLGPRSLEEITSLLLQCKKILWIGPVKFNFHSHNTGGESKLALIINKLLKRNCEITVVGNMACQALKIGSSFVSPCDMIGNASVVWEFLKGRKLPGVMALDRAFPFEIDWEGVYADATQPLVVDIGSGNGLFLFEMAKRRKDLNFLGLELNGKLVGCCLDFAQQSGIKNGYFIATNATTTFQSIISSYPGELVLVSIQCPNPDFNKPEHRWRMVQKSLVEAIADLLTSEGKVFVQSDIEAVAVRMKELFIRYGKGNLAVSDEHDYVNIGQGGWLKDNPFGIPSDWEQHVIDRGDPMYRLMLSKSAST